MSSAKNSEQVRRCGNESEPPGHHETWAALDPDAPGEPGCGGASYGGSETQPHFAEISLTVADECQHRGVGAMLLSPLWLRGAKAGFGAFFGYVLPENYRMLDWMRALGAGLKLETGQFVFHLPLSQGLLRPSPASEKLAKRLEELESKLC